MSEAGPNVDDMKEADDPHRRSGRPASTKTLPSDPGGKVRFDHYNVVVNHNDASEYVELYLSAPLMDGSFAETKVTLTAPVKVALGDGKYEYRMSSDTRLSVTQRKKGSTGEIITEERDGLSWEIPASYPGAWTALLEHEPRVKEFLASRFRPGAVFVDVGANVGAYSLRAASKGMNVVSFEPNPENVRVLRKNAENNKLSIEVHECALGAINGNGRLSPSGATSRVSDIGTIEIDLRTLDSFDLTKVDLLKIDVEGYELEVLKGARKTLERCHPTLMVEMHHWLDAEGESSIFNILLENGYRFSYLDRYSQGRHLVASYEGKGARPLSWSGQP